MTFYERYQEGFFHCESCGKIFTDRQFFNNLPVYKKNRFKIFHGIYTPKFYEKLIQK